MHVLDGTEGPVTDNVGIKKIAIDYYKNLFKWEPRPDMNLREDFFNEEEKNSKEENDRLESRFIKEEIKTAMFGSYSDGAPRPDGLPFMFYLEFLDSSQG